MPDLIPEKPKRDAEKRKRRPLARWQMLLIAVIVIFAAVWGVSSRITRPSGWWMTETIEVKATQHKAAASTAAAFFEPTKTAHAATSQAILATHPPAMNEFALTATNIVSEVTQTAYVHQLLYQQFDSSDVSPDVAASQPARDPTGMMLFATAAAFFDPTKTAQSAVAQTMLAADPPAMDEFAVTSTHFVFEVTQTAYVHQLETQAAHTTSAATPDAKNP
jgi:hypothetical protein